jgi:hypothetical protein
VHNPVEILGSSSWVGNYFPSRATLRLYKCLAGQISVKNAKAKKLPLAGRMWPAGRMLPPPGLAPSRLDKAKWLKILYFRVQDHAKTLIFSKFIFVVIFTNIKNTNCSKNLSQNNLLKYQKGTD